jgi:hypothetical protein
MKRAIIAAAITASSLVIEPVRADPLRERICIPCAPKMVRRESLGVWPGLAAFASGLAMGEALSVPMTGGQVCLPKDPNAP